MLMGRPYDSFDCLLFILDSNVPFSFKVLVMGPPSTSVPPPASHTPAHQIKVGVVPGPGTGPPCLPSGAIIYVLKACCDSGLQHNSENKTNWMKIRM